MQIWIQALNKYIEQLTNEVQNQFRTGIVPVQGETSLSLCRLLNRVQAANLMRIRIRDTGFHLLETKALNSYIFVFKQNKKYIVVPFLLAGLQSSPYGTMADLPVLYDTCCPRQQLAYARVIVPVPRHRSCGLSLVSVVTSGCHCFSGHSHPEI
jgi:hypothetical protein